MGTARERFGDGHCVGLWLITGLTCIAAVTGCGADESTATAPTPSATTTLATETNAMANELAGKSFSSTEVKGTEIPGGGPLVITFPDAGRVSLTAGCNRHIGSITVDGDTMTFHQLASTMMACPPPRDGADKWVAEFTKQPVTWAVHDDHLELSRGDQQVALVEVPPASMPPATS
ncbi:META domain-containing protein [Gordonia sp. CPCC 205515]|uniref:META domain-containing protein n=1 Tax=Gordonia sp. CPCC 205515 TaxID=3140791 RepID=UPI003AF38074